MAAAAAAGSSSTDLRPKRSNTTLLVLTYDHHAILAVESRITSPLFDEVDPIDHKKFLKPYPNSYIYLGFCGSLKCMQKLQAHLPQWCAGRTRPNNLKEAAREIQHYVNDTYSRKWGAKKGMDVDIVVVGAIQPEEKFGIFLIKKGIDSDRYKAEKVGDDKICIGSGAKVLNGNYLDAFQKDLTVDQSANYALGGVKIAVRKDFGSGGAINLIEIKRDSAVECVYKQNNPHDCNDEYLLRSRTAL